MITDDYINDLFDGRPSFGKPTDESVAMKRELIANTLKNQVDGYWSGHTIYHIVVDGGFLKDAKTSENKELTALGELFMRGNQERQG